MSFKRTFYLMSTALSCAVFSSHALAAEENLITCSEEASLQLSTYSADQIEPLLPLLEEWVQREFAQYPYLWLPPKGEYCLGNLALVPEKDTLVTLVKKGDEVIGLAAGIALDSPTYQEYLGNSIIEGAKAQGFDPSKMIYMSYFLTAPEHHNEQPLVELIYNQYVDFAHKIGKTQLCYFEDPGKSDHPLKPEMPMAIEPWGHVIQGFRNMNVQVELSWPTLQPDGSVHDEAHTAEFFVKDIN